MSTLHAASPGETEDIAAEYATTLAAGTVIGLTGPLGSGKTTFVRGLARGLGVAELVTSPSFSLIHEYAGRLALYHVDLYRVESVQEAELLDLDAYLYGEGVTVIEWAERAERLLPKWTRSVRFRINEDLTRSIFLDDAEHGGGADSTSRTGAHG